MPGTSGHAVPRERPAAAGVLLPAATGVAAVAANLVYLAVAAFLAWGRFGPAPFAG